jgi:hypothetical protein
VLQDFVERFLYNKFRLDIYTSKSLAANFNNLRLAQLTECTCRLIQNQQTGFSNQYTGCG